VTVIFRKIAQFKSSLFYLFSYFLVLLWPFAIVVSNPVPEEKDLISEKIKIIQASTAHPNLIGIRGDGTRGMFEFPSPTYDFIRGFGAPSVRKNYIDDIDRGCVAEIKAQRMRFVPFASVTRVWSIECNDTSLTYESMSESYTKNLHSNFFLFGFINIWVLAVFGLIIYSDWRKK
jgi:hypothetical protein